MTRYTMVIDLDRCTACSSCVIACQMENNVPHSTPESFAAKKTMFRTRVVPLKSEGKFPNPRVNIYPVLCNHCENPPCVAVCPVEGATYKRNDGVVLVNYDKCIGCRYCIAACPYGARNYEYEQQEKKEYHNPDIAIRKKGVVDKCTFCAHLLDRGIKEPACVRACPANARIFGDLDDPNSKVNKVLASRTSFVLRPDFGTKPRVYYV